MSDSAEFEQVRGALLARIEEVERELHTLEARHRDHLIGLQASLQTALAERDALRAELDRARRTE